MLACRLQQIGDSQLEWIDPTSPDIRACAGGIPTDLVLAFRDDAMKGLLAARLPPTVFSTILEKLILAVARRETQVLIPSAVMAQALKWTEYLMTPDMPTPQPSSFRMCSPDNEYSGTPHSPNPEGQEIFETGGLCATSR